MSAIAELRAGMPATAFTALLTRTILAVASTRNFPPPHGGQWTDEAAHEVAMDFVVQERAPKIFDALVLHCGDDRALGRSLQAVVRNFLRDRGRATEMGRLIVRLRRALRTSDRFKLLPGDRWGLADGPTDASGVGPAPLVAAAATVKVTFQPWSPTARRNEPFADRASIDALIEAVLVAAAGSLRPADIAHAVAQSLHVVAGNVLVELDPGDHPDTAAEIPGLDSLGDSIVNRARAFEVFGLLSDRERIAVAYNDLGARDLGPMVGLGHTQAALVKTRAIAVLRGELAGEENGQEVAEVVIEIAKIWCEYRTHLDDVTYPSA